MSLKIILLKLFINYNDHLAILATSCFKIILGPSKTVS